MNTVWYLSHFWIQTKLISSFQTKVAILWGTKVHICHARTIYYSNYISLIYRQYYMYFVIFISQLTNLRRPSLRKTSNLTHPEASDPKYGSSFLQLSYPTSVIRQCDKYQYPMNVQAQEYDERNSRFKVTK